MRIEYGKVDDDGFGHIRVQRKITHDDGTIEEGCHVFPVDALEWRAAEYGIDPADVDTLMDIILAEPYLTPEEQAEGPSLHDADTIKEAREAHLARCAKAKLRHRLSTRGKQHPLNEAKSRSILDPEAIGMKRELVEFGRKEWKREQAARQEGDRALRMNTLRHTLRAERARSKEQERR